MLCQGLYGIDHMYTVIHTYMYTIYIATGKYVYIYLRNMYLRIYMYVYVCTCTYVYIYVCICIRPVWCRCHLILKAIQTMNGAVLLGFVASPGTIYNHGLGRWHHL